jgi:hypothetical protein
MEARYKTDEERIPNSDFLRAVATAHVASGRRKPGAGKHQPACKAVAERGKGANEGLAVRTPSHSSNASSVRTSRACPRRQTRSPSARGGSKHRQAAAQKRIGPLSWPRELEALRLEARWLVALLRDSEAFRLQSAKRRSLDRPVETVSSSARDSRRRWSLVNSLDSEDGSKRSTMESGLAASSRLKPHCSRLFKTFKRARYGSGRACSGIRGFTLGAVKRRSGMENWNEVRMEVRNGAKERNGAH